MNAKRSLYQYIAFLALTTGVLLMIPLVAMQFTQEVVWTLNDFIIAGTILFGTGLIYKLVTRKSGDTPNRVAIGFALFTGFLLLWTNLAVGVIGSENNPVNLLYFGLIFIAIIGTFIARFQPKGMSLTMYSIAIGQALIAAIALIGGFYQPPSGTVFQIIAVNGFFISLFVVSALLFRYATHRNPIHSE
jgi:hypothetical protein